jgi:hypothetical protein
MMRCSSLVSRRFIVRILALTPVAPAIAGSSVREGFSLHGAYPAPERPEEAKGISRTCLMAGAALAALA